MTDLIVSSKWLNDNLTNKDLIILDASFNDKSDFKNIKIKGARYFDIATDFSELSSKFPNTLLESEKFEIACQKLGINKSSKIVVYDNIGIYSSPRVWWMFKTMGHENIAVLNGGLPDWIHHHFATEKTKKEKYHLGDFKSKFLSEKITYFDFMKANPKVGGSLVIDVRSADRFNGLIPESRKGLRSGNIPNSINIPYQYVLENKKYKSKKELIKLFSNFEIRDKSLVFTCGSGITACIVLLATELVIKNKKAVYDGSWTEYAQLEK